MSKYTEAAEAFLAKHKIRFHSKFLTYGYMPWDDPKKGQMRNIYRLSLSRGSARYSCRFGDSIHNTEMGNEPNAYDLLTSVTKYDPGSFEDFCGEFGYDEDSRKGERTYKAVVKDWARVEGFFSAEELEELREIQ